MKNLIPKILVVVLITLLSLLIESESAPYETAPTWPYNHDSRLVAGVVKPVMITSNK